VTSDEDETISASGAPPARSRHGELAPGQVFADRYEVQAPLGRGGMGAVYLVRDRQLDELVALKLLTLDSERAVERFRREVRLARRVTHPNVARTHDLGDHQGTHFLTMEYVRGNALDRVLENGALPAQRAVDIATQIAAGLEAAHAAGVIHRDLKPANVLIADDGRVVITDFGIARPARDDTHTHETGALVGTPHYMAPEQVLGRPVDARTDVYALGIILFELLTGRLPFDADTPIAAALVRTQDAPLDPRSLASVPDPLAELVLRCLAREPEARPPRAAAVIEMLTGVPTPSTPSSRSTPSGSHLFAPISPGRRAVAVLPFVYRGPADHDYLGEGLGEELIDVLSRTRGLRVLALGATRRFAEDRDPARIGAELAADAVVDGTVQLAGDRVRVSARLLETDTGLVRWTERFDARFEDVFAMQETMGRRVAEALRLELDAAAHRAVTSPEAMQLYLRARKAMRIDVGNRIDEAIRLLERTFELAPELTPAYPAHAIASIRAMWSEERDAEGVRHGRAERSVARALERAPELAETQLARAMLAIQMGEYTTAAQALARALEIAPTMVDAHYYLGELQVEAGLLSEGRRRCELALELDPTLLRVHFPLARAAALHGDYECAEQHMRIVDEGLATPSAAVLVGRLRFALWRGDHDEARRLTAAMADVPNETAPYLRVIGAVATGDAPPEQATRLRAALSTWSRNPRFASLILQVLVETFSAAGHRELALDALAECAAGTLVDLEWVRRCPLVLTLAGHPIHAEAVERVARRSKAMWRS
jgi:serine/threonine-protein kinase